MWGFSGVPILGQVFGLPEIGGVSDEPGASADQSDQPHERLRDRKHECFRQPAGDSRGSADGDEQGGGAGAVEGGAGDQHVLPSRGDREVEVAVVCEVKIHQFFAGIE